MAGTLWRLFEYYYYYTLQEEDQYNTRSKRVNYALFYCLGGRLVSMQNCSLVYRFLHGCGLHYIVLSGLSVKQEVKGLTTNYISVHYPGRKPVYLSSLMLQLSLLHEIKNIM